VTGFVELERRLSVCTFPQCDTEAAVNPEKQLAIHRSADCLLQQVLGPSALRSVCEGLQTLDRFVTDAVDPPFRGLPIIGDEPFFSGFKHELQCREGKAKSYASSHPGERACDIGPEAVFQRLLQGLHDIVLAGGLLLPA